MLPEEVEWERKRINALAIVAVTNAFRTKVAKTTLGFILAHPQYYQAIKAAIVAGTNYLKSNPDDWLNAKLVINAAALAAFD